MKVLCIVGARPNFVKIAPILSVMQLKEHLFEPVLVHTGQHYDVSMSDVFFEDLDLPEPDVELGVGSGTHTSQTARIMLALETECRRVEPDLVLVVGDVNSTLAAALVATQLGLPIAHVEAGLRSGDRSMPEEINRLVTDALADLLFATEESAVLNLRREGIAAEKILLVGNVMADTLIAYKDAAVSRRTWEKFGAAPDGYGVVTIHRPANVDNEKRLGDIVEALETVSAEMLLVFPVHPRTLRALSDCGMLSRLESANVSVASPMGYLDFIGLVAGSRLVLTDSGGLQEETSVLGVPCLTLRENTERPVTVEAGTNRIVGTEPSEIVREAARAVGEPKRPCKIPYWDGKAAERIVGALESLAPKLTMRCSRSS